MICLGSNIGYLDIPSFREIADHGHDRLGQFLALLCKNFHAYDDQDHTNGICIWPANNRTKSMVRELDLITGD